MREQKYAHVLEEYEEKLKNSRSIEDEILDDDFLDDDEETELGATREIKYKELQDEIDKEVTKKDELEEVEEASDDLEQTDEDITNVEDILEKTDHLKALEEMAQKQDEEETKEEQDEEDKKDDNVKIEQVSGKSNLSDLDDIYLTTSFKPLRKRFKFSKVFKKIIVFVIIFAIFFGVGYFGIYPLADKYLFNSPKRIFENSIDYITDFVNNSIKTEDENNKEIESLSYDYNIGFKTNIKDYEILNNYNYKLKIGMDFKQNVLLADLLMAKDNDQVGVQYYFKNKDSYLKFTTDDKYILYDENGEDIETWQIKDLINTLQQLSSSDIKYGLVEELKIMKSLLDDKYLSKEKDEITVDGKSISVTRNTLKVDQASAIELEKKFYEEVRKNKQLLKVSGTLSGMSVSEYEDFIDNINYDDMYDKDYEAAINIYTINGNKVVGVDYEVNGFRLAYYYKNGSEFDLYLNLTDDSICREGMDCVKDNKSVIQINGEEKDNITEAVVMYNNKKVATLNIRNFDEKLIDFDYELTYQNIYLTGYFRFENKEDNAKLDLRVNTDNNYMEFTIDMEADLNCKIMKMTENDYVKDSPEEEQKSSERLAKKIEEMGIVDALDKLFGDSSTEDNPNSSPPANVAGNVI